MFSSNYLFAVSSTIKGLFHVKNNLKWTVMRSQWKSIRHVIYIYILCMTQTSQSHCSHSVLHSKSTGTPDWDKRSEWSEQNCQTPAAKQLSLFKPLHNTYISSLLSLHFRPDLNITIIITKGHKQTQLQSRPFLWADPSTLFASVLLFL